MKDLWFAVGGFAGGVVVTAVLLHFSVTAAINKLRTDLAAYIAPAPKK